MYIYKIFIYIIIYQLCMTLAECQINILKSARNLFQSSNISTLLTNH